MEDRLRSHGSPLDHGLGLRSDHPDRLRFVECPVPQHREHNVGLPPGEAEQGLNVALARGDVAC